MKKVFFIGLMIVLASCEPGDLVDLPKSPFRITVLSFNEVGQPWNIIIGATKNPPFASGYELKYASVSIFEDGNFIEQLEYDTMTGMSMYDVSAFKSQENSPRAGHRYEVVVERDGLPPVRAEYVQPDPVAADISFDLREKKMFIYTVVSNTAPTRLDTGYSWVFNVTFKFTDPPGENFYDFKMTSSNSERGLDSAQFGYNISGYMQPETNSEGDFILNSMTNDQKFAGREVTISFLYSVSEDPYPIFDLEMPTWFRPSLRTMTKEQYKYIEQTRKQQLTLSDPYAQPITTFTNVEGGLGIFGGYTPTSKVFRYEFE